MATVVEGYGHEVRNFEGCRRPFERGVVEGPPGRGQLPDQPVELFGVFGVAGTAGQADHRLVVRPGVAEHLPGAEAAGATLEIAKEGRPDAAALPSIGSQPSSASRSVTSVVRLFRVRFVRPHRRSPGALPRGMAPSPLLVVAIIAQLPGRGSRFTAASTWLHPAHRPSGGVSYIARTGPFHVDEDKWTLTHTMFASLFPDWSGQIRPRVVRLEGAPCIAPRRAAVSASEKRSRTRPAMQGGCR
jgi:hypothetical protein